MRSRKKLQELKGFDEVRRLARELKKRKGRNPEFVALRVVASKHLPIMHRLEWAKENSRLGGEDVLDALAAAGIGD